MKILISGGTGFAGRQLAAHLVKEGHELTILTRSSRDNRRSSPAIQYLTGNPNREGPWQEAIKDHDAAINLAGASIFRRWTAKYKNIIRESRLHITRNLVAGIPSPPGEPFLLFNASAIGYYGFHRDEVLTEGSPQGDDFLARVAADWEKEALMARKKGTRVVITRFGLILGEKGGALGQMIPLFKIYLGGPVGSGKQWFSWIHMKDLGRVFSFLLKHREISGPVNVCAPNPVRNRDLARAIGQLLNRTSFLPMPAFLIKLVLGEFGSVVLQGQRVIPEKLEKAGFTFQYPDIHKALLDIFSASAGDDQLEK